MITFILIYCHHFTHIVSVYDLNVFQIKYGLLSISQLKYSRFCLLVLVAAWSLCITNCPPKIVSEYNQEIPQSKTTDKPMAPRGRATQICFKELQCKCYNKNLPFNFMSRCSYLSMACFFNYQFILGVKGQGQIKTKSLIRLITRTPLSFLRLRVFIYGTMIVYGV